MQLLSIETTPSPSCIKLNVNDIISSKALTLQHGAEQPDAPKVAQQLLAIDAVQSVFMFQDFFTLTRRGNADWQPILAQAANIIGVAAEADSKLLSQVAQPAKPQAASAESPSASNLGHVEVAVQVFRRIPVQVRATAADGQQARVALPERFSHSLQRAIGATGANYVAERRWEPYQAPAGSPNEVAQLVADEIASLVDDEELAQIEAAAIAHSEATESTHQTESPATLLAELHHPSWKHRLRALQQLEVTGETFTHIAAALNDQKSTIRRWAAALMGASEMEAAIEPLSQVVGSDSSAIVRRTAADALNDLGNPCAMPTMIQALADASKLVRWRAARFLNELGNQTAVDALRRAIEHESEFDVRIEMMAALERIEGGGDTQMPMWQRITQGEVAQSSSS